MVALQQYRIKRGLTQKDIADYLGIAVNSYQRLEYGTRNGSIPIWDKLEDFFHVPQRELRRLIDKPL